MMAGAALATSGDDSSMSEENSMSQISESGYYFSKVVDYDSFEDAVEAIRRELKSEGFGVLTEIDAQATVKEKLGKDFRPYLILGACNPPFAHQALVAEEWIGTLLPCNIVVQQRDDGVIMAGAMNPELMAQATGNPELEKLSLALKGKLLAVLEAL
jgi:uncharacterized protein (DUF302 family)